MMIGPVSATPYSARRAAMNVAATVSADGNMGQGPGQGQDRPFRDGSASARQLMRLVVESQMLAAAARGADMETRIAFDVARTLEQVDRLRDWGQRSSVTLRI